MPGFRIPKTIRWIFFCTVLLVVMQSAYRIGIYLFFKIPVEPGPLLQRSLWIGIRWDLYATAFVSLLVYLLGFAPGMHIFRRSAGKRIALFLYTFFALLLMLVATADFAHILSFNQRIDRSVITDILKRTPKGSTILSGIPWIPGMIAIGLATWFFFLIIRFMHQKIADSRTGDDKGMRRYWQVVALLVLVAAMYFSPSKGQAFLRFAAQQPAVTYASALSLNPLQSFLDGIFHESRKPPVVKP